MIFYIFNFYLKIMKLAPQRNLTHIKDRVKENFKINQTDLENYFQEQFIRFNSEDILIYGKNLIRNLR